MDGIKALQELLKDKKDTAWLLTATDEHGTEFVDPKDDLIRHLSGFTGEGGVLLVSRSKAWLFVDGRFALQAPKEAVSSVTVTVESREGRFYDLRARLEQEGLTQLLADGRRTLDAFASRLSTVAPFITIVDAPIVEVAWPERVERRAGDAWSLETEANGGSVEDKIRYLRESMGDEAFYVASSADVSWILNLRNDATRDTGLFQGTLYLDREIGLLFTNTSVPLSCSRTLSRLSVSVHAESEKGLIVSRLEERPCPCVRTSADGLMMRDRALLKDPVFDEAIALSRAVKSPAQIACARDDFACEDRAFTYLLFEIKTGRLTDEEEASERLEVLRKAIAPEYRFPSFSSIIAGGKNAAIIHYTPSREAHDRFPARGLILCDCGGQYPAATTDATRTILRGQATAREKRMYTRVLQAHIALARAVFRAGTTGHELDILAREPLYQEGTDYAHGTGHGVDLVGTVHAGPNAINGDARNRTPFLPGMITSDEPGHYEEGAFGVRLESLLLCEEKRPGYYGFTPLTAIPFDLSPLDQELLSHEEMDWLATYQRASVERLLATPEADQADYRDFLLSLLTPLSNMSK